MKTQFAEFSKCSASVSSMCTQKLLFFYPILSVAQHKAELWERTLISSQKYMLRFEVLTAVTMKNAVFWMSRRWNVSPPSSEWIALFLGRWFSWPWRWERYVPSKSRFLQEPHDVTSQKAAFFKRLSESTHLTQCKIWGFHGGDYEEWCLLGCYAVWLL
jgi:hypothetical protein